MEFLLIFVFVIFAFTITAFIIWAFENDFILKDKTIGDAINGIMHYYGPAIALYVVLVFIFGATRIYSYNKRESNKFRIAELKFQKEIGYVVYNENGRTIDYINSDGSLETVVINQIPNRKVIELSEPFPQRATFIRGADLTQPEIVTYKRLGS